MEKARRLGRGLDFLLPSSAPGPTSGPQQQQIELQRISRNPWQPRSEFDPTAMKALTESIRQHGIIQPVTVRSFEGGYQLVAGERRVVAARAAGLSSVPAVVRELNDDEMLLVALIENVQRQDLNPIERARALRQLVDQHNKSHDEVADLAGIARSTVSNSLRLLELDKDSIDALIAGRISEGHARALLAVADLVERRLLLTKIETNKLNVRSTELEVTSKKPIGTRKAATPSADGQRLGTLLGEHLKTRVDIVERGTRGRIVIRYSSLKEFERLFEALTGSQPPDE